MIGRLKKTIAAVLGDYSLYFIYRGEATLSSPMTVDPGALLVQEMDETALRAIGGELVDANIGYCGDGTRSFGCFVHGKMVGLCFYWFGARYRTRNFWPLHDDEAKLVQIVVSPPARGRGAAAALIRESAAAMALHGFGGLYARIWHSNTPSIRAFERAGWRRTALVVEVNPLRRERPLRLVWRFQVLGRSRPHG